MGAYEALAASYDRLTNDVDYEATVDFYYEILKQEGLKPRTAVDLACGTGSVTAILARKGLQVIGVDMSEEMLTVASQKAGDAWFICQRLEELRLPKAVDMAVCALDSLDYITDPENCREAIRKTYKYLNPGGIFIFDVNTPEKLRAMDGQVFLDEDDDVYCVWRGEFDEQTNICSYGMDLFQRKGNLWERSFEEHCEYAYSADQLVGYLKDAGFTHIRVYANRRLEAPAEGEQRIYIKARKGVLRPKAKEIRIHWHTALPFEEAMESDLAKTQGLYYITRVFGNKETSLYLGIATGCNWIKNRLKAHMDNWLYEKRGQIYVRFGHIEGCVNNEQKTEMIDHAESAILFDSAHKGLFPHNIAKRNTYTYYNIYQVQNEGDIFQLKSVINMYDHE